jgi:hypothetical protein
VTTASESPERGAAGGTRVEKVRRVLAKLALWTGIATLGIVVVGGTYLWVRLTDDEPVTWESDEDHFKYGSTGGERGWRNQFGFGIPYWVWVALPELFPEYLPDGATGQGYTAFGMIYEDGRDPRLDLPIGMSMRRVQGIDRVYFTCSVCHTGVVRDEPDGPRRIVLGMPANTFDLGSLGDFLFQAAANWKFRSSRIFPQIEELEALAAERSEEDDGGGNETVDGGGDDDLYRPDPLNPVDRLVFRYLGISLMREQLLTLTSRLSFVDVKGWGPGRVDTFNPPKALLGFNMVGAPERELVGNVDFPAVWHQSAKEGLQLHWDGNNTSVDERNLSAGFGTGATPTTLDEAGMLRIAAWLWDRAEPPPFPAEHLDAELAGQGEAVYREACWSCHGNPRPPFRTPGDGGRVGTVTPIEQVGTDRYRLDSYTAELSAAQNTLYAGFPEDRAACRARMAERFARAGSGERGARAYAATESAPDAPRGTPAGAPVTAAEAPPGTVRSAAEGGDTGADGGQAEEAERPSAPDRRGVRDRECYPARFSHFRKTNGYANMPLDGLWLRAPYLHNGSVPTLRALLDPPEARPDSFWIGYTVYDYESVGFVTDGEAARENGWLLDTTQPGNGNQGHLYGTDLLPGRKRALLEYLKTF